MLDLAPDDVIANETALRARFAAPGRLATLKQLDRLAHNCRRFIELSPFLLPGDLAAGRPRRRLAARTESARAEPTPKSAPNCVARGEMV